MSTTAIADIVCAVFMGILYARNFSSRNLSKSSRLLNVCLAAMMVSLLLDASAYAFVGPAYPVPFRFLINLLAFEGTCVNVILFTFYEEALFNEKGGVNPWFFRIIKPVEIIWAVATAYEFIAGHLITYGTNGVENLDYAFPDYIVALNLAIQIYLAAVSLFSGRRIGRDIAHLLALFFAAPVITSVLFSFLGIDFAYAFGAVMLGLVAEFIQKKQIMLLEKEKQRNLQAALDAASVEKQRVKMINSILDSANWIYEIDAENRVVSVTYGDIIKKKVDIGNDDDPMRWVELVHPEDRERVLAGFMAAITDRSGKTSYDEIFRLADRDGNFRWSRSVGEVIRRSDGTGEYVGMSMDMTRQMEEQQKRLLGAMPLSNDVLAKANIGMWAFELDEGQPPRMYDDETMLGLVGLDHQVPPEEAYHAWYDSIDEDSYDLVNDAVAKMMDGEHAEVQYPWHYPDGRTIIVRCGGVRNYGYTKGIRIEGTHQDVTQTLHYDDEERRRARQIENDLIISKLRADSLAYISDNEPDLDSALNFFGNRILEISGCDQVVYREPDGRKIVLNAPGIEEVPETICSRCPFSRFDCEAFDENGYVLMDDCRLGCGGMMAPADCPAKSSFMQMIYSGGNLVGKLTVHYLNDYHAFTENGINIMKTVAVYLGLLIGRVNEKKSEIARIEAESANRAKTEFLFSMSHDIRTPMNAILGYTDIGLRHVEDTAKSRDSYMKIKSAGGHLLNLINDILEMSRIESGKIELSEDPMDIRAALKNIHYMGESLAAPKDIDLKVEVGELKNPYLYADELHVSEIIINLISNAVKYTPEGGRVTCSADQISDVIDGRVTYRFEVADNGIGMSEEFQRHLFEAFSREQTSTVSKIEGTGLGLSIVKKIVDMSGGSIRVKSRQRVGSTFTVEMPFLVMDEEAAGEFMAAAAVNEGTDEEISFEGRRVLLVEDNEMNREIATELLEESGLAVDTASDGEAAVREVLNKGIRWYDFILMDIQMPVMNGYEATKAIRALPNGGSVPIIALSANAFAEDRQKSLDAGMDDHVAKPINVRELFAVLARFM